MDNKRYTEIINYHGDVEEKMNNVEAIEICERVAVTLELIISARTVKFLLSTI